MKIIKSHVSLNGEIIEMHCKTSVFEGLAGCVRERKKYQTNIKNDTRIHYEINDKCM